MTSPQETLQNLAKIGKLKAEPPDQAEFDGLLRSARNRLPDAQNPGLNPESRFSLAYDAAHSLALAALRWHGYRSENRYIVFQILGSTVSLPKDTPNTTAPIRCRSAGRFTAERGGLLSRRNPPFAKSHLRVILSRISRQQSGIKTGKRQRRRKPQRSRLFSTSTRLCYPNASGLQAARLPNHSDMRGKL
jgi:hypothetical protein